MRRLLFPLVILVGLSACAHPPQLKTQQADQIIRWLDLATDSVIAARDSTWLSAATTDKIEVGIAVLIPVIKADPAGAKATVLAGLHALQAQLAGDSKVSPYLSWIVSDIQGLP